MIAATILRCPVRPEAGVADGFHSAPSLDGRAALPLNPWPGALEGQKVHGHDTSEWYHPVCSYCRQETQGMLTASALSGVNRPSASNQHQSRMAVQHASIDREEQSQPPGTRERGTLRYGWIGFFTAILRLIYIPRSSDQHRVQGVLFGHRFPTFEKGAPVGSVSKLCFIWRCSGIRILQSHTQSWWSATSFHSHHGSLVRAPRPSGLDFLET